ncbi:MAG: efflux RND transporter periplasmic adaptor subunit [Candidatus Wallbacteria bacterium]|nr:efflux RND transporter periplasmic adaptor subunit [Candidatus Wallbacteria bacterium]
MNLNKYKSPHFLKISIPILIIILMLAYQGGCFVFGKINPGRMEESVQPEGNFTLASATRIMIERHYEEPGIITTRVKAELSPQVMGTIRELLVKPGDTVEAGQELVRISSEQMTAKLEDIKKARQQAESMKIQADQQLISARAALTQADANFKRIKELYAQNATAKAQLEDAETRFKQAQAMASSAEEGVRIAQSGIERADKSVQETGITLSYNTLTAPFSGVITRKYSEPGDLAVPGKPVLSLNDTGTLLLEADVRESLKDSVSLGQKLYVEIGANSYPGLVSEIVPQVDPGTRTFTVRVSLEPIKGLFIGMYGKVLIPAGQIEIVTAPEASVKSFGQLDSVLVHAGGSFIRKYVKTGEYRENGRVEILSGLSGDEELAVEESRQ